MEATSETVNLALFDGAGTVYVDQVANSNSFLRMFTRVGTRVPLHCTGVGKACLAGLPKEFLLEYWRTTEKKRYTEKTITDEPRLKTDLQSIRRLGYAVDDEEMEIEGPLRGFRDPPGSRECHRRGEHFRAQFAADRFESFGRWRDGSTYCRPYFR